MAATMFLASLIVLALAPSGAPVPVPDDDALGRYSIRDDRGRALCELEFKPGPSISGREAALKPGCGVAALKDITSWSYGDDGGFVLRGPLRNVLATVLETDAGYVLRLADDRRYDFVALDTAPALTPRERAIGRWTVHRGDRAVCHVQLSANQRAVPDAQCPPDVRAALIGAWQSVDTELVLTLPDKSRKHFRWTDAATLEGNELMLVRD